MPDCVLVIRRDRQWANSVHSDMPTGHDLSSLVQARKLSQSVTLCFVWLTLRSFFLSFILSFHKMLSNVFRLAMKGIRATISVPHIYFVSVPYLRFYFPFDV
jgi:hypothetical protein